MPGAVRETAPTGSGWMVQLMRYKLLEMVLYQDLRKIGFHAKIEGIFPKKARKRFNCVSPIIDRFRV